MSIELSSHLYTGNSNEDNDNNNSGNKSGNHVDSFGNVENTSNISNITMAATVTPTTDANGTSLLKKPVVCVLCVSLLLFMLMISN